MMSLNSDHLQLFVGNLPHNVTEAELVDLFGKFGKVCTIYFFLLILYLDFFLSLLFSHFSFLSHSFSLLLLCIAAFWPRLFV